MILALLEFCDLGGDMLAVSADGIGMLTGLIGLESRSRGFRDKGPNCVVLGIVNHGSQLLIDHCQFDTQSHEALTYLRKTAFDPTCDHGLTLPDRVAQQEKARHIC